jgi:hypothetical protein
MHKGESSRPGSVRVITQAQADNCCASSERESSNQSNPTFVASLTTQAVLGTGVIILAIVPARVLSDAWRAAAPRPTTPVPKHVLLSVFLV